MKIDLLKIDVEGDEIEVLNSIGEANWPLIRQIVVEVHDINERLATAVNLLTVHGYRCTLPTTHSNIYDRLTLRPLPLTHPSTISLQHLLLIRHG